jgi:hypothetical protein
MLSLFAFSLAFAQDDVDLSDPGSNLSYEGHLSGTGAAYAKGKPVTITHTSGNLSVHCMETDTISGRLGYTVYGSAEGPMESYGKSIGLAVWGDANGGGAKTRIGSKPSGVSYADVTLTVNVPKGTTAVTVSHSGRGWVQVDGCSGNVKVTAGAGGAYVGGPITGFTVSASGGDVKVVSDADTVLKNASTASAPAGKVTVVLASAQGGKLTAKGEEVAVAQTVMGTNTPTLVSGDMGIAGPTITLSAKGRVEVTGP